ncbi:MAG TPA: alpha/beta hydrolase [Patescibacteria group bacterium]|jgi:pimeloyl-ACP methyl ester carboxylesterase|nr:alpha/beta hydrolase [Patescibacteria group bacterium]
MQIVIDGLLTNYQVLGEAKEVLLILPGWRRSITEWTPIAQNLAAKYKVVLLDLPGFDLTALPKSIFGVCEYASFVKKFLEKLRINKCVILGHSFGGRVAIVLASEGQIVTKLVLVDSAGIEKKSLYVKLANALKIIAFPIISALPNSIKNKISNSVGSTDYKTSGEMRKIFVKIVNQDLRKLLPRIKIPTFIIWGDKDDVLSVSQTKIFKQEIKGAKVRIVWGAGHDPHLQRMEQFLTILKEIL